MKLRQAKKILKAACRSGNPWNRVLFAMNFYHYWDHRFELAYHRVARGKCNKCCGLFRKEIRMQSEFVRIQEAKQKSTLVFQGKYTIQ